MATLEELTAIATQEVEDAKPMHVASSDGRREFTDDEYDIKINDIANQKYHDQQFGYIENRVLAYGSIGDQLDMMYADLLNDTTTWKDHVAQVKADNPKPE